MTMGPVAPHGPNVTGKCRQVRLGAGRRIQFPKGVRVLGLRASTSPVLVPAEPGVIGETDGVQIYVHSSIHG